SGLEQSVVTHHLLDIRDPSESYSAAQFHTDATSIIQDVRARGRLPLVSGGTMLYYKALREGLNALPGADWEIRAEIDNEARRLGWPALHQQLAQYDPETAER